MAIFHAHTQVIGKSSGKSAVAAAAYRSASKLVEHNVDRDTGITTETTWDYSKKNGVVFSKIITPDNAASWMNDREQLWNKIQELGVHKRARYSREFEIALPVELSCKQNKELLIEIVERCFVSKGMIADINMHYDNTENPHSHIMLTMRELIKLDDGGLDFGLQNMQWDKISFLKEVREQIAEITNKHLEMHGYDSRISHLSHKARGILLEPTIHIGVTGKHAPSSVRRERNDEIINNNANKIAKYPELVIDKLSINKPAFTASDIEKELKKALLLGLNLEQDNQKTGENEPINGKDNSENNAQESTKFDETSDYFKDKLLTSYSLVISSPKLTLINPRDLKGRMLFARTDRVQLEDRIRNHIETLAASHSYVVDMIKEEPKNDNDDKPGAQLSQQQQAAVQSILGGSNLSVLEGFPGAGKTTVMKEVSELLIAAGYNVMGTAVTNKACQELAARLGIEVANTTKLRQTWQQQKGYGYKYGDQNQASLNLKYSYYKEEQYSDAQAAIPSNTVIIIDEASQLDTPTMDYFLSAAVKSNSKLILLGDNNQNPAIGAKGAFMKAGDIAGRVHLTEINRHKHSNTSIRDAHIQATQALGNYDIDEALLIYQSLGVINILKNEQEKEWALVNDAVAKIIELANESKTNKDTVALSSVAVGAYTNLEANSLNAQIRSQLKGAGIVKGKGQMHNSGRGEELELCIGDQIIFAKNQPLKGQYGGVNNNDIGIISKLGDGEFVVMLKCQASKKGYREVKISTKDGAAQFKYGYALTNYALQGATINHKFYSLDKYTGYEAFNVGATRHEIDCKFYASEETLENELYKTKDLDIEAVKAEYVANAYKYCGEKKVDVPLWKLGMSLLVSKRTDLNFARDYTYHNGDKTSKTSTKLNRKLDQARSLIEVERVKWLGSDEALKTWEQTQSQSIEDETNIDDSIIKIDLNINQVDDKNQNNRFETELAKHFKFNAGEINIDAKAILGSRKAFKAASSAEGHQIESSYQLDKRILQQVSLLKQGVATNLGTEHLNWSDLSELQQNLVLLSLLSKEERKELTSLIRTAHKAEQVIDAQRAVLADLSIKLNESAASDNDLLAGNLGKLRDYLNSRIEVVAAQKIMQEHDRELNRPVVKHELISLAADVFGVKLEELSELKGKSIVGAAKGFAAYYFNKHAEEITKLKEIKSAELTKEDKIRLNELFNVRGARADRIVELCASSQKQNEPIAPGDLNLILAHLIDSAKNSTGISYKDLKEAVKVLSLAYEQRAGLAKQIVKHYLGYIPAEGQQQAKDNIADTTANQGEHQQAEATLNTVTNVKAAEVLSNDNDSNSDPAQTQLPVTAEQVKVSQLLSQLSINYTTVKKHAGLINERHYFEAKNQTNQLLVNEHYSSLMKNLSTVAWSRELNKAQAEKLLVEVSNSYQVLETSIKDSRAGWSELDLKIEEISEEKYALEHKLMSNDNYCHKLMPEYLRRVYNADPVKVLANWQALVQTEGLNMALEQVKAKPEVLNPKMMGIGSLKGIGIGKLFNTENRSAALTNIEALVPQLKSYEESLKVITKTSIELASAKYNDELKGLITAKETTEKLLPSTKEAQMLELIKTHLAENNQVHNDATTLTETPAEVKVTSHDALSILNKIVDHDIVEDALLEHYHATELNKQQSKDNSQDQQGVDNLNLKPASVDSHDQEASVIDETSTISKEAKIATTSTELKPTTTTLTDSDKSVQESKKLNISTASARVIDLFAKENDQSSKVVTDNKNKISNNSSGKSRYRTTAKTSTSINTEKQSSYVDTRITYEQVDKAATSSGYEEIFRTYAHMMVNKKIIRKIDSISAGSLSMNLREGLWIRFSTGEAGNIYSFVSTATKCSKHDALQIVARKFGVYQGEMVHQANNLGVTAPIIYASKAKDEWVARSKADQDQPLRPEQHLAHMLRNNKLEGLYEYKNTDNETIGYTARFVEYETGKKNVLPVAYCYNEVQDSYKWKLKGFNDREFKPIYGAEKINLNLKQVLIVEGEKAADRASELLPEYTVISWLGGSNGAAKADWSIVKDREVVIWPDNDEPGFRAASTIAGLINTANNHSGMVTVIDPRNIQFDGKTHEHLFECGWDLADSLPNGITINNIKQVMSAARTVNNDLTTVDGLISKVEQHYKGEESSQKIAKRILWQDKTKGITTNFTDLEKEVKLEHDCLAEFNSYTTLRADDYQGYSNRLGRLASKHEFLSVNNELYRDILVQLGKREPEVPWADKFNNIQHEYAGLAYHRKAARLLRLGPVVGSDRLTDSDQLNKVINERTVIADDAKILHTLQMGVTLTKDHEHKLEQVALRGRDVNSLSYFEGDNIEGKIWQEVSNPKWWQQIVTKDNHKVRDRKTEKHNEVDKLVKVEAKQIAKLSTFNSDYDLNQLKKELEVINPENRRSYIEDKLYLAFSASVLLKLAKINQQKSEAKSVKELFVVIVREKKYCLAIYEKDQSLCDKLAHIAKNDQINKIHTVYSDNPKIHYDLAREVNNLSKFWPEEKILESLHQGAAAQQYHVLVQKLFKANQNNLVEEVKSDLRTFKAKGFIERDNIRYDSAILYLDRRIDHPDTGHYLKGTKIEQGLEKLRQLIPEKQQELDQQKTLEKEHRIEHTFKM
ncbi:MAG: hypothetical protein EOP45_00725 [Sphingobacteriaceae bacterium]|nr:MAG: hypothetical protein EOP45_00725 [Sphingobacteriaceae bacterium]